MKVMVLGSHLCPRTLGALRELYKVDVPVDFRDILSCHADLKMYLKYRDSHELYADIRNTDKIGIPLFIFEDGTVTRTLKDVFDKVGK